MSLASWPRFIGEHPFAAIFSGSELRTARTHFVGYLLKTWGTDHRRKFRSLNSDNMDG